MATRQDPDVSAGDAPLAEIVEASSTRFRAVATQAFAAPAFGSFVRTSDGSRTIFGVVAQVEHASIDPSRRAIPLGRTWEELEREQPQVLELLTTEFEAMCVAFADGRTPVRAYLPPVPPRVHDFVYCCTGQEIHELTADLTFIRTLGSCGLPVAGELVAAAIRSAADQHTDRRAFLVRAGREVADLYRQDYEQASAIIRRFGIDPGGSGGRSVESKPSSTRANRRAGNGRDA
jgi:hypothetical protein